ncbi:MAG: orotidine-5'-phosphate decarboxylase [Phycisphaerae bacterium]|nr:orotidine-5'-phosphate decarboxylase [Phycisphaerae bacterium]
MEHFADRLTAAVAARATPAIVGLDPVLERLPAELRRHANTASAAAEATEEFCRVVLDAVAPVVPGVKINSAFFEVFHQAGIAAYYRLIAYAHSLGLLVIGDIKRGDIGSTARLYAAAHLVEPPFSDVDPASIPDAVTLAGYLGESAVRPFIEAAKAGGRGVFILVRPSDPGADEVHEFAGFGGSVRLYEMMGRLVERWGRRSDLIGHCGLSCVGAVVAPKDLTSTATLRVQLPRTPFLVPGYGAQGASAAECRPCFRRDGTGAVVNASRSVIYAYEHPEMVQQYGADWRACIAAAARAFAADVAPLIQ